MKNVTNVKFKAWLKKKPSNIQRNLFLDIFKSLDKKGYDEPDVNRNVIKILTHCHVPLKRLTNEEIFDLTRTKEIKSIEDQWQSKKDTKYYVSHSSKKCNVERVKFPSKSAFQQEEATYNQSSKYSATYTQEGNVQIKSKPQMVVYQPDEATYSIVAATTPSEDSANTKDKKKEGNNILQTDFTKDIFTVAGSKQETSKLASKHTEPIEKEDLGNKLNSNCSDKSKSERKFNGPIENITNKINSEINDIYEGDTHKNNKIKQSNNEDLKSAMSCDLPIVGKSVPSPTINPIHSQSGTITHCSGEATSINTIESNSSLQQASVGMSMVQQESTMLESVLKNSSTRNNCNKEIPISESSSGNTLKICIEKKSSGVLSETVDESMHDQAIKPIHTSSVTAKSEEIITEKSKENSVTNSLFNDDVCTPNNNTIETNDKSILHIIEVQKRLQHNLLKRKMKESTNSAKHPRNVDKYKESNKNVSFENVKQNLAITKNSDNIIFSETKPIENTKNSIYFTKNINVESSNKSNVQTISKSHVIKPNPQHIVFQKCIPSNSIISNLSENSLKEASKETKLPNLDVTSIETSDKPNLCVSPEVRSKSCTTTLFNESCVESAKPKSYKKSNDQKTLLKTSSQMYMCEDKSVKNGIVTELFENVNTTSKQYLKKQSTFQEPTVRTAKSDSLSYNAVKETSDSTKEGSTDSNQPDVTSVQIETNTLMPLSQANSIVKSSKFVDTVTSQVLVGEENNTHTMIAGEKIQNENLLALSDNTVSSSALEQPFSRSNLLINNRSKDVTAMQPQSLQTNSSPEELRTMNLTGLRNTEFNKLLQNVFQLYKDFFQQPKTNQEVIVPVEMKCAAIKCFQLMKRHIIVDDKDVPYILLRMYSDKFKETTENKITKVAEVLHLSIADSNRRKERINSAYKLTSSSLREEEKARAESEYQKSINSRSTTFKNIFFSVLHEFKVATPILLMPLYFRTTQALLRFDKGNAAYVYIVREQMFDLLTNDNSIWPIGNSVRDDVLSFLTFPKNVFLSCFTFVKELLISFFELACDRAEAKEVLEFAQFEPCSPQLQQLLSRQQQISKQCYEKSEISKNNTPCAQKGNIYIPSVSTNMVHQNPFSLQAEVTQDKINPTMFCHQIPSSNYMQKLATPNQNFQEIVTSKQSSIGQVPQIRQQFQSSIGQVPQKRQQFQSSIGQVPHIRQQFHSNQSSIGQVSHVSQQFHSNQSSIGQVSHDSQQFHSNQSSINQVSHVSQQFHSNQSSIGQVSHVSQQFHSNQSSIGQVPHVSQQFQTHQNPTYTQNKKSIQAVYPQNKGMQQQMFQNKNQHGDLQIQVPFQETNKTVFRDGYQQNPYSLMVQNTNPSTLHIPHQQTSQTSPNYQPAKQTLDNKHTNLQRRHELYSSSNNTIGIHQNLQLPIEVVSSTKQPPSFTAAMSQKRIIVREMSQRQNMTYREQRPVQLFAADGPQQLLPQTTLTRNPGVMSSIQRVANSEVAPNISNLGQYSTAPPEMEEVRFCIYPNCRQLATITCSTCKAAFYCSQDCQHINMVSVVPNPLDLSDPALLAENWELFKTQWKNYLILAEAGALGGTRLNTPKLKMAMFTTIIGRDGLRLIERIIDLNESTLDQVIEALDKYFLGTKNSLYERFVFNGIVQRTNECIKDFIARLKEQARSCDIGYLASLGKTGLEDTLICDRLVVGLNSTELKRSLLRRKDLKLDEAVEMCMQHETTDKFVKEMSAKPEVAVFQSNNKHLVYKKWTCRFCGKNHNKGAKNCPAFGKVCMTCKKKNHFSNMCRSSGAVNLLQEEDSKTVKGEDSQSEEEVMELNSKSKFKKKLFVKLLINNKLTKFQLDSGATCNVMGISDLKIILGTENPKLDSSFVTLSFYGGSSQPSLGNILLKARFRKKVYDLKFEILNSERNPLLGAEDCLRLGLITTDEEVFQALSTSNKARTYYQGTIFDQFPTVFEGLGCFEGLCSIRTDPSVSPSVAAPRRQPLALKKEICAELDRLEKLGVIVKVTEPTDWVSSLVVVKKPNKLRLCIDPFHLNKAIKRSHYQSPTIEEIAPQLSGAKFFSVLDLKDGFWHVKLNEESSRLTTFWTPKGRFRWTRLPFGVSNAPEEFQRRVHENIEGLEGVVAIADDVMVFGKGKTIQEAKNDHDKKLNALLQRAQMKGFKFNKDKCKIGVKQISYMGHLITADGLCADPQKVEAISKLPAPTSKEEVKRFLGYIVYLSKFLPRLSEIATPIRTLLKDDSEWVWDSPQENAFKKLIKLVQEAPTLKYFDETQRCVVQCDASQYGLGTCLMQQGQPVAYASRTLTSTEVAYAQIEKECLSILFGLERFEQYLMGHHDVVVESDHKPLEAIFKKPLISAPKRLQRMLLRLQKYNFCVKYIPGTSMYVADFLSRAPLKVTDSTTIDALVFQSELEHINDLDNINITDERIKEIREKTMNCPVMIKLMETIKRGWPEKRSNISQDLHEYWSIRDELSEVDGVVIKGDRIIVPRSLRPAMLKILHCSHQGVESCLRRAREVLFWPGMARDIKNTVETCWPCQKYAPAQKAEPLKPHETPSRAWQRVGVDYFQLGNEHFLIMTDYFSSFFEIKKVSSLRADGLIQFCKEQFSRYGIPDVLVSDSGTQLLSQALQEFAKTWMFKIVVSSPHNHQSNGKAESAVKIAKRMLKKIKESKEDFQAALLEWRNTPVADLGASPVQLLMSRSTKTRLPVAETKLEPKVHTGIEDKLKIKQEKYKKQYDKGTCVLEPLKVGQKVLIQKKPDLKAEPWVPGLVVALEGLRSYIVSIEGRLFRRNRRFIRPFKVKEGDVGLTI